MSLNYSKWDNLELSDDSDFEPHPNVDKRSFIRAKQNQIHQQRHQRRHQIETLKYERIINDALLSRIDKLVKALQAYGSTSHNADELVFQALMDSVGAPEDDQPPTPPEGVHTREAEQPTYSKMMATLVDQVKKEVDESKAEDRLEAYVQAVGRHRSKVKDLQGELENKLAELEKEDSRKITSDSIHIGFDSSFVSKPEKKESAKKGTSGPVESVEVLNPSALKRDPTDGLTSTSPASKTEVADEADKDDEEHIEPSKLGKAFAKIKIGDYRACAQYISENPAVVAERETDGLLIEAFNSQLEGKDDYARQCVHQALLLQYCRSLGRDGVSLFFKRITTKGHQAQKVFLDDVSSTYARIRTRTKEIASERAARESDKSGDVERIQLHSVDPGTTINIVIPQPDSEDEVEKRARATFESFSPSLQKALESGSLGEVNKVLGDMSVEEAEEVVGQLGEGGMISVEEQVIDTTTEEGQQRLKEIESQAHSAEKQPETFEDPA